MKCSNTNIRLDDIEIKNICIAFKNCFLEKDSLWLFGSRVDLKKKGGDIDLYIETNAKSIVSAIEMKQNFLFDLEKSIGEQKIDAVLFMKNFPKHLLIHEIAKREGIKLV